MTETNTTKKAEEEMLRFHFFRTLLVISIIPIVLVGPSLALSWLLFGEVRTWVLLVWGVFAIFVFPMRAYHLLALWSMGAPARMMAPIVAEVLRNTVTFDDNHIVRTMADGQRESVRWDDVRTISVVLTTLDEFCLAFHADAGGGCLVPSGSDGFRALIDKVLDLPGFDYDGMSDALELRHQGREETEAFIVWQRDAAESLSAEPAEEVSESQPE